MQLVHLAIRRHMSVPLVFYRTVSCPLHLGPSHLRRRM